MAGVTVTRRHGATTTQSPIGRRALLLSLWAARCLYVPYTSSLPIVHPNMKLTKFIKLTRMIQHSGSHIILRFKKSSRTVEVNHENSQTVKV